MPRPYLPLNLNKFVGENDTTPSADIEDAAASLAQNLYLVNGGLERRLGQTLINTAQTQTDGLQGLAWCRVPALTPAEYVVGVKLGSLYDYYNAGVPGAPTALTGGGSRFNATASLDMAVVDSKLYAADGTSAMVRFNGTNVKKSGSSPPTTAPTFNAFVSTGVLTGNVAYYVTYLDADGNESEPSPVSAVLAPSAQNITLNLPNDTDSDRSGKNLYRQGVLSTLFKLVNSSPISATATTYTDSVADASLGLAIVLGNTLMPSCAHLWEHDGRLFGCGNAALPNVLFISNQFQPWYCPSSPNTSDPTQGLRLQIQGKNAKIVGGCSHGGYVFIFTDEGGYILQGTSQDDYRLDAFTNHGCCSHRSIKSLRNWLMWVGPEGIFRYGGYEGTYSGISGYDALGVTRIDNPILQFFAAKSGQNLSQSVAWVYNNRYYLGFPSDGSGTPGQPGGGIAAVDPGTLPNLALYLKGTTGITQSGGFVTAWADQSGNNRSFTYISAGGTTPTYNAGVPAGANSMMLENGGGGRSYAAMQSTVWTSSPPAILGTNGVTIYYVAKMVRLTPMPIGGWQASNGSSLGYFIIYDNGAGTAGYTGTPGARLHTDTGADIVAPVPDTTSFHVYAASYGSSVASLYVDGVIQGSAGWAGNGLANLVLQNISIGTSPDGQVDVASVVVFAGTHDTTTVKAVTKWFKTNYIL